MFRSKYNKIKAVFPFFQLISLRKDLLIDAIIYEQF